MWDILTLKSNIVINIIHNTWKNQCDVNHVLKGQQIKDLCNMRDKYIGQEWILTKSETNDIIAYLCTE